MLPPVRHDGACRAGIVDFDMFDCIAYKSIESLWHLWYVRHRDYFNSMIGNRAYRCVSNRARREDEQHDEQQRFQISPLIACVNFTESKPSK